MIALSIAIVSSQQCPTWFVREADNKCVCGKQIDTDLQCSNETKKTRILASFCLTYNNDTEHFGTCPYNTHSIFSSFTDTPSDVSKLDEEMCGPLNRTGLLCSHCQPGLGPAVFSYYRECKECLPQPYGWLLYFFRLIVPLTLLCVLVIMLRVNVAHPVLNCFVMTAQVSSTTLFNNSPFLITKYKNPYSITKFFADISGIFNLDFFVFLLPSFCINENMSTLTVIALEYLVAFYPILFTLAVYLLIILHDRGYKIVVTCWRPFHKCLARCRRSWELKGSVVNAFVTFLILSYSKICSISLNLLKPIPLYDKYGHVTYTLYFAADLNISMYIPLAILASIIAITMILLSTTFLLFYQNRFFQRCLHFSKIKCILIHELANILQSYFKNGITSSSRDLRWFAGIYLLLRIIFIAFSSQRYHFLVYQLVAILSLVLILGLCPYKKNCYNYMDAFLVGGFAVGLAVYIYQRAFQNLGVFSSILIIGISVVYILLVVLWVIFYFAIPCCGTGFSCYCRRLTSQLQASLKVNADIEPLPHRISDPNEYEPLIRKT